MDRVRARNLQAAVSSRHGGHPGMANEHRVAEFSRRKKVLEEEEWPDVYREGESCIVVHIIASRVSRVTISI
jgi:hypothetical protein